MAEGCLLYYITDRKAFTGDETTRRRSLLDKIAEAARAGVDYIQLREKDIAPRELEQLTGLAMNAVREAQAPTGNHRRATTVLINSRTDVALAAGADGVHLRSDDVSPREMRAVWSSGVAAPFNKLRRGASRESVPREAVVAVSCHSPREAAKAATDGADFAVFGPVFEKKGMPGARAAGIDRLKQACSAGIPVLALGGLTLENAQACLNAGAAGIAGIRLFQENDIAEVASRLRALHS